jgi:hypothetical protein
MTHIEQVQKRIHILNSMIASYKSISRTSTTSQNDIDNMLFVLTRWKTETELLLRDLQLRESSQ